MVAGNISTEPACGTQLHMSLLRPESGPGPKLWGSSGGHFHPGIASFLLGGLGKLLKSPEPYFHHEYSGTVDYTYLRDKIYATLLVSGLCPGPTTPSHPMFRSKTCVIFLSSRGSWNGSSGSTGFDLKYSSYFLVTSEASHATLLI